MFFGKFTPMFGERSDKVAIKVEDKSTYDSLVKAKLMLPIGDAYEDRVFSARITKSGFVNTVKPGSAWTLIEWARECGRDVSELCGARSSRNSVEVEFDADGTLLLSFE